MTRPGPGGCRAKRRYDDPERAKQAAINIMNHDPAVRRLRVYPCPWCKFLHITSGQGQNWIWQAEREREEQIASSHQ